MKTRKLTFVSLLTALFITLSRLKRVTVRTLAGSLVVSALCLASAPAAATQFYIGTGAPQMVPSPAGIEQVIAPLVGVSPDQGGKEYRVEVTLEVNGPRGFHCKVRAAKKANYNPGKRMPTRLVVFYPLYGEDTGPPEKYRVKSTIIKVTPAVQGNQPGSNQHEATVELPKGGQAKCTPTMRDKLIDQAQAPRPLDPGALFVEQRFKCPQSTTVKFNWANKIQANPDFPLSPSYENLTRSARFTGSVVYTDSNELVCLYVVSQAPTGWAWLLTAPYVYKVPRKIVSCTGQPGPQITCKLKK